MDGVLKGARINYQRVSFCLYHEAFLSGIKFHIPQHGQVSELRLYAIVNPVNTTNIKGINYEGYGV